MRSDTRVAVVTGGSSGIGLATARALAAQGIQVVIAARNAGRGEAAVAEIQRDGGEALFVRTDVSREADVSALFETVRRRFGRLDCLFNNAGTAEPGFVDNLTISEELVDQMLGTNVKGVFLGLKHGLPLLLETGGGTVVNVSTIMGSIVFVPPTLLYGVTKAAIISLTRGFAAIYGGQGIRTYAVCPVSTDTPMLGTGVGEVTAEIKAHFARLNPSGKLVQPEEVAAVVLSLVAGTAGYENGDVITIDNGQMYKLALPGMV